MLWADRSWRRNKFSLSSLFLLSLFLFTTWARPLISRRRGSLLPLFSTSVAFAKQFSARFTP